MTRRLQVPLLVAAAILAVSLLHVSGILNSVENGIRYVFLPVARAFSAIGFGLGNASRPAQSVTSLQDQIRDLQSRLSSIAVDYVQLQSLQEENRALRNVAKFLTGSAYDHVGARVIAHTTDPHANTILIDRGAIDGVENGMAVVAEDGIFVGKITTITERTATVTLVPDEDSRVAAALPGTQQLIGMVQGEGNGVASLTLIPQAQPLKPNDIIVTAGTEEKIPPNLAIGLVNEVQGKPTDPFKTAMLEPLAQVNRLELVIVLRPVALRPNGS